jgi:hypothetical protein
MSVQAIIHILGEDAVLAELDQLPDPTHTYLVCRNLRKKDGKPLPYLADGATAVLYSWSRVTFIELMGDFVGTTAATKTPTSHGTTVLGFFRDE